MSVEQLLDRLDDRFRLLSMGNRAARSRQRTLRALVDWSFELCSEPEQLLWARLSVFARGFDLDAVEGVCSDKELRREEMLDLVAGLVDKSILVPETDGDVTLYRMLETIRQYGAERLAQLGEWRSVARSHRDWYLRAAGQMDAEWFGHRQTEWITRLHRGVANLRAALEFCATTPEEAEAGLAMSAALGYYWIAGGHLSEGRHWVERMLEANPVSTAQHAKAYRVLSWIHILLGDGVSVDQALADSCELAARHGDPEGADHIVLPSGVAHLYREEIPRAAQLLERAVALHRGRGEPCGVVIALVHLAMAMSADGRDQQAIPLLDDALDICAEHGEYWLRSYAMIGLAIRLWRLSDLPRAAALTRDAIKISYRRADSLAVGIGVAVLAWIGANAGHHKRAAQLLGAHHAILHRAGSSLAGMRPIIRHHEQCTISTRDVLGARWFDRAFRAGAELDLQQAVTLALNEDAENTNGGNAAGSRQQHALTKRELEIAALVAEGLSNKEIAARSVIALRTAEGHVEHILSKMNFTSRAQIAAWVAERRATARASAS